jgi:hypothetical protein
MSPENIAWTIKKRRLMEMMTLKKMTMMKINPEN